jgi:lysine N6-hydroxylase
VKTYDLVGVGIGPFNLGLAALADSLDGLDVLFLEARECFSWHPGLLIEGATLQVPFLADLVTLVDPTSRWSFLNYLREHDRLFPFYFSERFHVPRREYDHYCRWVATSLPSCRFGSRVESITWNGDTFTVTYRSGDQTSAVHARHVVLGVGTEPVVPAALAGLTGKHVFHAAEYLDHVADLADVRDITVVGSGQSGAEVFLDLLRRQPQARYRLRWLTRSRAFAPMEYSKIGLEHFTPDYVRYFHGLPETTRDRLVGEQWQLYKGVSAATLAEIHDELYERGVGGGRADAELMPGVAVERVEPTGGRYRLGCRHAEQEAEFSLVTDRIVLATGYAARTPSLLDPLAELTGRDSHGRLRVGADYRVALPAEVTGSLFVQNAELHTHGVGAPDLGLGAWRSATILNSLTGRMVYRLPDTSAYTTFGVPAGSAPGEGG